jgi:hypothetical protein
MMLCPWLAKARNGRPGIVPLTLDPYRMRFEDPNSYRVSLDGGHRTMNPSNSNVHQSDEDENVCGIYPEHDYVLMDDRDGRTYRCRRCDAETWEEDEDA